MTNDEEEPMKPTVKAKIEAIERLEGDLRALASAYLFEGGEIEISAAERAVQDSVIDVVAALTPIGDRDIDALLRAIDGPEDDDGS